MEEQKISCPKCGSSQLTANKKGFSGKKAVVGGILTGGIGILAGTLGSNKILITCLNCGNQFKPGDSYKKEQKFQVEQAKIDRRIKAKEDLKNAPLAVKIITYGIILLLIVGLIKACS
jgi:DNA-directed RNA polymerase subunit RPC12/RpoP